MNLVEIIRPVTTGGVTHERGEIVDAQNWPKLNSMLRAGKVRPYVSPEVLAHVGAIPDANPKGEAHGKRQTSR